MERSSKYIIERVLESGMYQDWVLIRDYYGIPRIAEEAKTFRSLNPKALSFISTVSDTDIKDYRCYTMRQSIPQHWNF